MSDVSSQTGSPRLGFRRRFLGAFGNDKLAVLAFLWLTLVALAVIFGPHLFGREANAMQLAMRNAPPGSLDKGWLFVLGADSLGRSLLARIIVGSRNTIAIAGAATLIAMVVGGLCGVLAGYIGGWTSTIASRLADVLMSFPALLLAIVILYVFGARPSYVVFVLAISRVPVFIRTARAETLEISARPFIAAARVVGAKSGWIMTRHIVPLVAPTLMTIATVEFAALMLLESGLSFLGIGVQPPEITWGLMVAQGRGYLATAWWLSVWPGLAISLTAMSFTLIAAWLRMRIDPSQKWRFYGRAGA